MRPSREPRRRAFRWRCRPAREQVADDQRPGSADCCSARFVASAIGQAPRSAAPGAMSVVEPSTKTWSEVDGRDDESGVAPPVRFPAATPSPSSASDDAVACEAGTNGESRLRGQIDRQQVAERGRRRAQERRAGARDLGHRRHRVAARLSSAGPLSVCADAPPAASILTSATPVAPSRRPGTRRRPSRPPAARRGEGRCRSRSSRGTPRAGSTRNTGAWFCRCRSRASRTRPRRPWPTPGDRGRGRAEISQSGASEPPRERQPVPSGPNSGARLIGAVLGDAGAVGPVLEEAVEGRGGHDGADAVEDVGPDRLDFP